MEQSSSRLYSGPLSLEAQKILAVLRAKSQHAARHNNNYSHNHRQIVERNNGSQREPWTQSSWSMSQEESKERDTDRPQVSSFSTSYHDAPNQWQSSQTSTCYQYSQTPDRSLSSRASSCSSSCWDSSLQRQTSQTEAYYRCSQIYSHRNYSEPPVCQSSTALSFTQQEETAASFSHRDRCTSLSLQIPERLCENQAPWRNSSEEIRPPFTHNLSLDEEDLDEVLFPTTEHPIARKAAPALACPRVSSRFKISKETEKEHRDADSWHIPRKKLDHTVASEGQAKRKLPLSNPTEDAISGGGDGGILYHQSEEGAQQIVGSENMMQTGTAQVSDRGHEMQNGVTCKESRHRPNEKGSAKELEGLLLGTIEANLNLVFPSNMDKSFHCYSEDAKSEQKEDFEYRFNRPEIKEVEHAPGIEDKLISVGCLGEHKVSHCQAENPQDISQTVTETAEEHRTENPPMQCEPNKLVLGDTTSDNLERTTEEGIDVMEVGLEVHRENSAGIDASPEDKMESEQHHCSGVQIKESQCETDYREVNELPGGDAEPGKRGEDRHEAVMPPVDNENGSTSAEDSGRESCSTPTLSPECRAKRSGFRAPCLLGKHQHHGNEKVSCCRTANGNVKGSSLSGVLASPSTFAAGQNSPSVQDLASTATKPSKELENSHLLTSQTHSRHPHLISFPLKRKHEVLQRQYADPPKIYLTTRPPKWEPPHSCQVKAGEGGVSELKRAKPETSIPEPPEPQTKASSSHKTGKVSRVHKHLYAPKQTRQKKVEEKCRESVRNAPKQSPSSVTCKPLKSGPEQGINGPKISHEEANGNEPRSQSKAGCLTATLTSDPRVKDAGKMNPGERMQTLEKTKETEALVLTLVYRDGTTQLDPEQFAPAVCGLLVLMKNSLDHSTPEDSLGPNDSLVYLKLEHTPAWAQQHTHQSQELFTRDMLLQVLSRSQLVVCYKAKDLLRTALQFYRRNLSWKQVAGCHIQDPQVSGWLLDPANPSSCYQDLLNKHRKRPHTVPALRTKKVSQVISGLYSLYWLNMELCFKLQSQGLWELYSDMELNMISVLAAMESHRIYVDKEALKRTSDLLGAKMKQLEQEAHRAAGQIFLVTSSAQLRTVLFEKLCLHERCENKKLPKTINKQQQSTSEAALLQLQDLHPLPKIILEYRQVHKIKSTFVDGILSCMMSKNYVSSTWHQTSAVTGRISAKHPNFQALPRQPLQITKKQYIQGKEEEVVTVHPRAMFIPQEGWTFLSADFCQVELRLLAHLSSDPELLRIFHNPQADVFTMLASQWKGVSEGEVTSEDREHAKRIVYSVVYGAGRERLSGILGVSAEQASRFQDSFLQTYREVQAFVQRTIQQCHKQGYVLSIMGRRRTLPNINSPDWGIRMQAERQAVNFVVQGSAADLCKMAMIRIFNLVSSSSSLSARLVAQLHDELLYEVEDSQVEQFAGLVRSTMESLQHIDQLGVYLKVPLKVAVSSGKSWGSMSELNIPPMSPSL
ncbi:DNA polymerase nu isoform X3 [Sebastes umbrosus]|uniref:DNA polymerase nu isoform X3 n=1 Tax=Sebastes umbrosus TaxID=72105 RepID=UPI00189FD7FA|nr:DNA polymerase nu isoform X3 [Sebastes umbrosus]